MPEWLLAGLDLPGLWGLLGTAFAAGLVYGFAGFGAALIFMPISVMLVPPVFAVASFSLAAMGSVFTVLPRALRDADRRAAFTMLGAAFAVLPLGVWVLRTTDPTALRWAVSLIVLVTLAAMMAGWRYRGTPGVPAWLGIGAGVGFLGGSVGLTGPALVLFQLSGRDEPQRTRANSIVVLTLSGFATLPLIWAQGALPGGAVAAGLLMLPVYAAGTVLGGHLFDPARAVLYRRVAYAIIGAAAILGLPVFT